MRSILITQCLQRDFVGPLAPWEPLPCTLHIGASESARLMGPDPAEGPLVRFVAWAHDQSPESLGILHIRDRHRADDPRQAGHLAHFGPHCLDGTPGLEFVFPLPDARGRTLDIIDSPSLNDFLGTDLAARLESAMEPDLRFGIIGVWTDAKVSFLAYELRTRYPHADIAVCSALTASSSRERHVLALDHLDRIIGVRILHSVGAFASFLVPDAALPDELPSRKSFLSAVAMTGCDGLSPVDRELIAWLFRGCMRIEAKVLDGGFSGNVVLGVESRDLHGHVEAPHVVKIGNSEAIGRERSAFESIEPVLGNSAPRIVDVSDRGGRGAIKYRYASMTGTKSRTFQALWKEGIPLETVEEILGAVLREQLGRLFRAAAPEQADLLEVWDFRGTWADILEKSIGLLATRTASGNLKVADGVEAFDPLPFYRTTVPGARGRISEQVLFSRVHGDLNGANILVDGHRNAWIIDFFHSRRHHLLGDFAKLENDLLYLWTPVPDEAALRDHKMLMERVVALPDLGGRIPDAAEAGVPAAMQRTWETVRMIRGILAEFVGTYRHPWQYHLAALRYAAHTLSFEEASLLQKKAALVGAGMLARSCGTHLDESLSLRVDWVPRAGKRPIGLTILPGRKDRLRDLEKDIGELVRQKVTHVATLVTSEELRTFGVSGLADDLKARGIGHFHFPIADQMACDLKGMGELVDWLDKGSLGEGAVVVHCLGGLGRSGMAAACLLVKDGLNAEAGIETVRNHRSPRAIETAAQEQFVRAFAAASAGSRG